MHSVFNFNSFGNSPLIGGSMQTGFTRLAALFFIISVPFVACSQNNTPNTQESAVSSQGALPFSDKYVIARSEIGDVVDIIPARGVFQAAKQVVVGSEVSGKIIKLYVKSDDKVKKGQVLAELDPEPFQAAVKQSRSDIRISQSIIKRLEAELAKAQKQLTRRTRVKDYLDEPLETIDNLRYDIEALKAQIDGARARLDKDRANLRVREFNLGRTRILAPIDGIVRKVNIEEGANINASFKSPELFVITSDTTNMQVSAQISELDIARLKPGQTVKVTPAALPNTELFAKISSIESSPVKRGNFVSYKAIIDFNGLPVPGVIKPGMSASLRIYGENLRDVARLPIGAIYTVPRQDFQPDIKALGLSLEDYPNIPKSGSAREGALWGITIAYFFRHNQRMIFIIEDGKIKIHGIRVTGESEDYIAYDEKDLPVGTPVIVGKKKQ